MNLLPSPKHTSKFISKISTWGLAALACTCFASTGVAQINWAPDVQSASRAAASQNKLVLLHFEAEWNRPSKNLDNFVYRDPKVQRSFAENVIPVRVDADTQSGLVKKHGVEDLPYDIVMTPAGRVVMKRKCPTNATAYNSMLSGLTRTRNSINASDRTLDQDLQRLEQAVHNASPSKLENAQTASFTPQFPLHKQHSPSAQSLALKQKSKLVRNPFVKDSQAGNESTFYPPSQNVSNQTYQNQTIQNPGLSNQWQQNQTAPQLPPAQKLAAPMQLQPPMAAPPALDMNRTGPNTIPGQIVAPKSLKLAETKPQDFTTENPHVALETPSAFQAQSNSPNVLNLKASNPTNLQKTEPAITFPPQPALKALQQSDVAAKLVREQAQQKHAQFRAKPKLVMNDTFYGEASVKRPVTSMAGNYQAKIKIPNSSTDFVPEPPLLGEADAQIVFNRSQNSINANAQARNLGTPAILASSPHSMIKRPSSQGNIENGLKQAATTTTETKYALHGKCPVTLLTQSKWVDGDQKIGCVHRNRIYIFASQKNLELFQTDPDAFSPILAGYDPVVYADTGRLIDGIEEFGVFMGKTPRQRIVLFTSPETRARFQQAPRQYLENVRQAMLNSGGASSNLIR